VRQLLAHTSGIVDYTTFEDFRERYRRDLPRDEILAEIFAHELTHVPGESWAYSNGGYFVLGRILEQASGQQYDRLLAQRIFDPLGMRSSALQEPGWTRRHRKRERRYRSRDRRHRLRCHPRRLLALDLQQPLMVVRRRRDPLHGAGSGSLGRRSRRKLPHRPGEGSDLDPDPASGRIESRVRTGMDAQRRTGRPALRLSSR
jgi:CubicO group peptidase (beta-lactamase class C family)